MHNFQHKITFFSSYLGPLGHKLTLSYIKFNVSNYFATPNTNFFKNNPHHLISLCVHLLLNHQSKHYYLTTRLFANTQFLTLYLPKTPFHLS